MQHADGRLIVVEHVLIELVVFFPGDLALLLFPERNHGIYGLDLLGHYGFAALFFRGRRLFNGHSDRVTNIVRIFFDQALDKVFVQITAVLLLLGIRFDIERDDRPVLSLFRGLDLITVRAVARPEIRLLRAVRLAQHLHAPSHHECGIKTDAELTDHVHIGVFMRFLERQ